MKGQRRSYGGLKPFVMCQLSTGLARGMEGRNIGKSKGGVMEDSSQLSTGLARVMEGRSIGKSKGGVMEDSSHLL